ncbi:MAG: hypothetical protein DMG57_34420 [Acidobacteria bacterium]|nr:MAG: hypothetical protein DMG57_34420 [Acidobacteriota bacterium]
MRSIARLLETKSDHVAAAEDEEEALQRWRTGQFNWILMDVQMPQMDGRECTAAIRSLEAQNGGHIPIVALTVHALKGDENRCLKAGMDDYIAKPFKTAELLATIERVTSLLSKPLCRNIRFTMLISERRARKISSRRRSA